MAGGKLTVTVETYAQAPAVAQRILCQMSAANRPFLLTDRAANGAIAFVLPEERFPANLLLKRLGTDLLAGYVAGTNITYHAGNGNAIEQNVNTCPASTNQPTTTGAAFNINVGGNPLATSLVYANLGGAGTVNIFWGDGTSTLGAAESGTSAHTYTSTGVYKIQVVDATSSADVASMYVDVNSTL
jgi:hypothetical protein